MTWTIGDVIAATLRAFQRNWVTLMVTSLLATLISFGPALSWMAVAMPQLAREHGSAVLSGGMVGSLFLSILSAFVLMVLFAPAMSRIALAAARGEQPRIGQLFDFRGAFSFLAAGLLAWVSIAGATLLLIIPGIIVATGLALTAFFVVDRNLDAMSALNASWAATRGNRLHLFGLITIACVVNWLVSTILGATVWLLPLQLAWSIAWTPLSLLGLAIAYLRVAPPPSAQNALPAPSSHA